MDNYGRFNNCKTTNSDRLLIENNNNYLLDKKIIIYFK